ncbi:MAG: adenine deaminase [Thermodesulfobacteriota bacterium]
MNHLTAVARGLEPADLLLVNAHLVNVFSAEIYPTNVAISGAWIAGVGQEYTQGKEIIDLEGLFLLPGLINGHLHLESSFLTPAEYARLALAHGTTTIILDPHEIANVLGLAGVQAFLDICQNLPLDFFFLAPSCVPASSLETAGGNISAKDIEKSLDDRRFLGLGEMMNYPGVLQNDPEVKQKIAVTQKKGKVVDGHAPLLRQKDLNAYIASGIDSDHECTSKQEGEEKLRLGMWIMIREGTTAKNLDDLLPLINTQNSRRCLFVLDDLEPGDLLIKGEMDYLLRRAVALGLDPITAIQMATINPALRFKLSDRGAIVPGKRADLLAVSDLKNFAAAFTIKDGKVVAREGKTYPFLASSLNQKYLQTIKIKPLTEEALALKMNGAKAWVIGLLPNQIITQKRCLPVKKDEEDLVKTDLENDLLKVAVIERHKASGRIGLGLVQGFGLKKGALASSLAHDSHNIIVIGTNDEDMKLAIAEMHRMQGGLIVTAQGAVKAALPLPFAGLISLEKAEVVADRLAQANQAAQKLGCKLKNPFLALSFLTLSVIPELKITDQGLVDVFTFKIIPLEAI